MRYGTWEEVVKYSERKLKRLKSRLRKETVVAVKDGAALLSNGCVLFCVTCPTCGERFMELQDTDCEHYEPVCPACRHFCNWELNPFWEDCPVRGLPWTGAMPSVGMSFKSLLNREEH